MNTTIRTPLALAVAAGVILAACGGGDDEAATTSTVASTTTTESTVSDTTAAPVTTAEATTTTADIEPVLRMPLTGRPIASEDEIPNRPAMVVKIPNNPEARPQAGLNEADIVFEENNGGITRFAAIFHEQDSEPLGPIRSGRSQDVQLLGAFQSPLFVWSGGNPTVNRMVRDSDLISLSDGTPGMYRRSGRGGAPHNLYASGTEAMWENTPDEFELPIEVFPYLRPDEEFEGDPATTIEVPMEGVTVTWEWDESSGLYQRFQNGRAHETELSGQVTASNVVVMGVNYRPSVADRRSPDAETVGAGPVYLFSDGLVRVGQWIRLDRLDGWGFIEEGGDGSEMLGLEPGRTWVELAKNAENFVTWDA